MSDANVPRELSHGLSPEILRARAQRRRETAGRLWDERLEQMLLEEAEELERDAAALELEGAIGAPDANAASRAAAPDRAALHEPAKSR